MCVYSMIMDHYGDEWERRKYVPIYPVYPNPFIPYPRNPLLPEPLPNYPTYIPPNVTITTNTTPTPQITPQEIEEFHRLLERAREYDKRNNEPDCELQQKKDKLIRLAKELGVDITFP